MSSVRPDSRVLRPHPGLVRWQRGLEAPRHLTACPAMNSGASLLPWLQKVMTDRVTPSCGGNLDLWGRYPGPVSRSPIRAACEVTRPAISLLMDEGAARSVDFAEGVPRGGTFVIDTRRSPEECAAFRLAGRVMTVPGDIGTRHLERPIGRGYQLAPLDLNRGSSGPWRGADQRSRWRSRSGSFPSLRARSRSPTNRRRAASASSW